jgi:hypothetical protein
MVANEVNKFGQIFPKSKIQGYGVVISMLFVSRILHFFFCPTLSEFENFLLCERLNGF